MTVKFIQGLRFADDDTICLLRTSPRTKKCLFEANCNSPAMYFMARVTPTYYIYGIDSAEHSARVYIPRIG